MPSAPISALLTPGMKAEFALAYQPRYAGIVGEIGDVAWLDATSDKLFEVYGIIDSAVHPARWDPGRTIPSKKIGGSQFTITNRDFGRRVLLPRNADDEQTGQLLNVSRSTGGRWVLLPERIFYQYIQASTDADLLPAVPNSADGNALYLATTRYGSADGNVVTQTGSTTTQTVITDLYSGVQRFRDFQDTESQPFWDITFTRSISVFYGTSLTLVMEQVANQAMTHSVVSSTGAAVTNIVMSGTVNWKFVSSQRITNSRLYLFLRNLPTELRPIVRQVRKGMTEAQGNWDVSDYTRDTGEVYFQFHSREGWGSANARGTIRIS